MKISRGINPVVRAIGVFSAVAIVAGGVTYAALADSVTLADNSASTANSDLKIWDGGDWAKQATGFNLANLVPGDYSEPYFFYFKNDSTADLELTAGLSNDEANPISLNGVASEDVKLRFMSHAPGCSENTTTVTLAELQVGSIELPCNPLDVEAQGNAGVPATEGNYSVEVKIVSTDDQEGATISNLDLLFTGTVAEDQVDDDGTPVTLP
jgi:hypothetical protein